MNIHAQIKFNAGVWEYKWINPSDGVYEHFYKPVNDEWKSGGTSICPNVIIENFKRAYHLDNDYIKDQVHYYFFTEILSEIKEIRVNFHNGDVVSFPSKEEFLKFFS